MTIPVPLEVRLKSGRAFRSVTRELRDLTFRAVDPGGYASATFSFDRPLTFRPDELAYFSRVYITDGRHGGTIWEGRVEDPGRAATADGQVWDITAIGPSVHASDKRIPYIVVDSDVSARWRPSDLNYPSATTTSTDISDEEHAWHVSGLHGVAGACPVGFSAGVKYRALYDTGQDPARVRFSMVNAITSANWQNRINTRTSPTSAGTNRANNTWSTSSQGLAASIGGANTLPTSGSRVIELRIQRFASDVGGSDAWGNFYNLTVRSKLLNADGTPREGASDYTANTVKAHEVVNDLLGRVLDQYDTTTAAVATGTYNFDHLCWPDGVTAAEVFDELLAGEPAYTWAAWESNATTGKYRFEWKVRPSTVRYETTVGDGFNSPASAADLYNEALVRYTDWAGRVRTRTVTSAVPELDDAGITRTLFVDLGDEAGSAANADQAGASALAEHRYPPNAGTLTITRRTIDMTTGRYVMPWEIRPGELIRVRGVRPSIDALNATDRDGQTVFRIKSVDFNAADAATTLELDSYTRSVARAIAKAEKRRRR